LEKLYKIAISPGLSIDCIGDDALRLARNDWCIVRNDRCIDYGRVTSVGAAPEDFDRSSSPIALRRASLEDQRCRNDREQDANGFRETARRCIATRRLPMTLVSCHYSFDGSMLLFQYTAPERVDFRELLKDLRARISCRIELRQVGPRDVAGMIGGLGSCGRELCCSSFLNNFVNINSKMARVQGLSMNPSGIMGACGRLKCCLDFEYEGYQELLRAMPRVGSACRCPGGSGKVLQCNPLQRTVTLSMVSGGGVVTVAADQVTVEDKAPVGAGRDLS
jgi:cell fate regulator YaaT (PSP1 superfamily)